MTLRNAFDNLALDTSVAQVKTSVDTVNTTAGQVKTSVDIVKTSVDTVNSSVNTSSGLVKTAVDTVNSSVNNLSSTVSTTNAGVKNSVDEVSATLGIVNTSVGTVNTSVGQVKTSVDTVNTTLGTVNTSVGIVNTSVNTVNDSITSSNLLIGAVNTSVNTSAGQVKTSVDTVNTTLGTVNTSVGQVKTSVDTVNATLNNGIIVKPDNVDLQFKENFTQLDLTTWSLTSGSGDIISVDGNSSGASYLVISKDPLTAGTETKLESINSYSAPAELIVGLSMSQRNLGQFASAEFVSDETLLSSVSDIAISSISQTTTTVTITTSSNHNLSTGERIGIYGVTGDSRLNYPMLVVSAISSPTTFSATAGPGGTIPTGSLGPFSTQGYVYYRPALGYSKQGFSQIWENATTTNSSNYVRSGFGSYFATGTISSNHSTTCGSTTSSQLALAAYTYAFTAGIEYRYLLQEDRVGFYDIGLNTTSMASGRTNITTVVPDVTKKYKIRFRAGNDKGLTIPNAKIVSVSKSGTTTATVTTASAHGLTTGDYIVAYGVRDTTNFAALTTQTVVASVINSTSFTVVWGSAVTATSYGGFVSRVQGANIPVNFSSIAAQSASVSTTAYGNLLTIIGSGTWAPTVGDFVNVYGLRDNTSGADIGVDGTYKVVDVATTTIVLLPVGSTTLPTTIASTNCGGAVIKRTDVRISYVRLLKYLRERIEVVSKSDSLSSVPVQINGGSVTVGSGSITPINSNAYTLQTSTNLAASATYTGSTLTNYASSTSSTMYYTQLVVGVTHTAGLTPGQLYVDYGTETSSTAPTTWYTGLAVPIPSNANMQYFTVPIFTRYYRLRFVNGATAQTNFRLSTVQTYNGGGLSGELAYPTHLLFPLSTTALAASATFTGATLDFGDTMNIYKTITAIVYTDQASGTNGFQIQVSRDGTNWRVASQATVTASTLTTLSASLLYRYARVVYTNGATLQGSFAIDANVEAV